MSADSEFTDRSFRPRGRNLGSLKKMVGTQLSFKSPKELKNEANNLLKLMHASNISSRRASNLSPAARPPIQAQIIEHPKEDAYSSLSISFDSDERIEEI